MTAPHGTYDGGRCSRRALLRAAGALAVAGLAPGWLAACGGDAAPAPPAIAFGEDVCDWCRMTVDDPKLAAVFVPASGRALRFGEPGCLLAWLADSQRPAGTAFLAAQEDSAWIPAAAARLALGVIRTPMRFDIAAWRQAPPAGRQAYTWDQLVQQGAPDVQQT